MTALLSFVTGGGLLALVRAVLTAWGMAQAKRAGATERTAVEQGKVLSDVAVSQDITRTVSSSDSDSVTEQLREFQRD